MRCAPVRAFFCPARRPASRCFLARAAFCSAFCRGDCAFLACCVCLPFFAFAAPLRLSAVFLVDARFWPREATPRPPVPLRALALAGRALERESTFLPPALPGRRTCLVFPPADFPAGLLSLPAPFAVRFPGRVALPAPGRLRGLGRDEADPRAVRPLGRTPWLPLTDCRGERPPA